MSGSPSTPTPEAGQPVSPHVATGVSSAAQDTPRGIILMIGFAMLAPCIDVFAKLATESLPSGQISLARFAVQALALLPFVIWRGAFLRLTPRMAGLHFLRGLLMAVATVCFITAVREMPIADAIAIFFVEPMILTVLGGLLLGERVGWRRYTACAVGFLGAMIVVRPSFQELGFVALLPLGTALAFAFYLILTRSMAQREDPIAMQGFAGLSGAFCLTIALLVMTGSGSPEFDPVWPDLRGWLLMGAVGFFATVSHLFLVFAFRKAPASVLAPLQYLEIVAATLFGYLIWGDFPDALKWLGIGIIVGSGLFIFWRERIVAEREAALTKQGS